MVQCDICGKECKTAQGLAGHKRFKHGVAPGPQLPLEKHDLLITDSKLERLLDERFSVVSDQLDELAGSVGELQLGLPSVVEQLNRRRSITDFSMPEQVAFLEGTLRGLDAEATAILLINAGKEDMLQHATDEEVAEVEARQKAEEAGVKPSPTKADKELVEWIKELWEKKAKVAEEENAVVGEVKKPGWKYLPRLNISIREH